MLTLAVGPLAYISSRSATPSPGAEPAAVAAHRDASAIPTALESELIMLVNRERLDRGLGPLAFDPALLTAARLRAEAHAAGENVVQLQSGPYAGVTAHAALLRSAQHRENMLLPASNRVAAGVAEDGAGHLTVVEFFASAAPAPPAAAQLPVTLSFGTPRQGPSLGRAPRVARGGRQGWLPLPIAWQDNQFLFGVGPEADAAARSRIAQDLPVQLLTSWYNGPDDLRWITQWRRDLVPNVYALDKALHLIVFSDVPEGPLDTVYGPACGRPYPLSDRFLGDMGQLADTFAGPRDGPPLYVTLFTELQTYACTDNEWNSDPASNNYYRALRDRYMEALRVFHERAPNARVSLGWGGWQARWDAPTVGGGRSMLKYFDDAMRASDFQSFQAMQNDSNVDDIRAMVHVLNDYGPVLLAHYRPDNGSQSVFEKDVRSFLTEPFLRELYGAGLVGVSFMDERMMNANEEIYEYIRGFIAEFGRM